MTSTAWFGLLAMVLLGLSAIAGGVLVLSGGRHRRHPTGGRNGGKLALCASTQLDLVRTPFAAAVLDVATEARDILARMAADAAGYLVQLEVAVQPDLAVHADRLALRAVLSQLVGNAVRRAAGGRVLLSAIRLGGRVQFAVIDDGIGPDAAVQVAALREIAQLVALQGGTLDVEAQRGEGTTVLVRLPEPGTARSAPGKPPAHQQANRSVTAPPVAQEALAGYCWDI